MQIIITGGAGFLGQLLAQQLIKSNIEFDELLLIDILMPLNSIDDRRVKCIQIDLSEPDAIKPFVNENTGIVFHLAAVVSSHAEKDFELGWKVNVDCTRSLLEICKTQNSNIRFVFASSCAVFGGNLPLVVNDQMALMPQSSYGAQKAIAELMVNDYSRKGYLDGRILRLPTVCVRPGKPNLAASSFVSGIIREPINGEMAVCPVHPHLGVWISSPNTIIQNFIYAAEIKAEILGMWRVVNLPGIRVTVADMLKSLQKMTHEKIVDLIKFEKNEAISLIVNSWPTEIDNSRALELGFVVDNHFDDFITQYLKHN